MLTFENQAAQGDLFIRRIDQLPEGLSAARPENGAYIVAHSETGHHHIVMDRPGVTVFDDPTDALKAYLQVIGDDIQIEHQRSFDTHAPIHVPPGNYEIRRQREYTPEGFRRAAD